MSKIGNPPSGGQAAGPKIPGERGSEAGPEPARSITRPLSLGPKTTRLDTVDLPPRPELLGPRAPVFQALPQPTRRPGLFSRVFTRIRKLVRLEPPPPTLESFSAQHKAALDKLPADQRKQVEKLARYFIQENEQNSRQAHKRLEAVGKLLDSGKLTKKDASKHAVLDLIVARLDDGLAGWSRSPEIKKDLRNDPEQLREKILGNLLKVVASPDKVYQGYGTSDCTTAVLEGFFAGESPVAFTRFALGLAFEGKAATPSGQTIPAQPGAVKRDMELISGRDVLDALFQGSLLAYAKERFKSSGEEIKGGRASGKSATYGAKDVSSEGLTFGQIVGLTSTVFGPGALYFAAEVNNGNRQMVVDKLTRVFQDPQAAVGPAPRTSPFPAFGPVRRPSLQVGVETERGTLGRIAATPLTRVVAGGFGAIFSRLASQNLGKGAALEVPVGIQSDQGGLHQILVRGMKDGVVTFSDPGDAQVKTMKLDEFASRLQSVILPRDLSPDF